MIWSRSEIRAARQTPLKPVLERLGYRLNPIANDNYVVIGRFPEIVIKDHYWVCADTGQAGNAIDFLVKLRGLSFNEAMKQLSSQAADGIANPPEPYDRKGRESTRADSPIQPVVS